MPMNTAFLKTRQTKYGAYMATYLIIVLAVLASCNYLANRYNKTADLTGSKLFSLADQSVKIVKNLKSDVKIHYFDRADAFDNSRFGPSPRDLLSRYSNLSPKVQVEYVDPIRTPKAAQDMGVTSLGTVIIEANGRREEAKGTSEEQVTNALIRVLKPDKRTACFLTGHGEHDIDDATKGDGFSAAKDALTGANFTTKSVSLLEKTPAVPADCTVLIVAGPKTDLLDAETEAIRKFVQGGGRALFMLDPVTKNVNTTALVKLLSDWSVQVNDDIVVDLSGVGQLYGTDELSPLVSKYENHAITRDMGKVYTLFPLARSVTAGTLKGDVTVEKLFGTSSNSYAIKEFRNSTVLKVDQKRDTAGPINLGVAAVYNSPAPASADAPKAANGRFVVTGSSRFVSNSYMGFPGGNKDLFLNIMAWLTNDEDLISIRPKEVEDSRLTLTQGQVSRILYANVFGLPLLIIGLGTWVWWRRR